MRAEAKKTTIFVTHIAHACGGLLRLPICVVCIQIVWIGREQVVHVADRQAQSIVVAVGSTACSFLVHTQISNKMDIRWCSKKQQSFEGATAAYISDKTLLQNLGSSYNIPTS